MTIAITIPVASNVRILVPKVNIGAGINQIDITIPTNTCSMIVLVSSLRSLVAAATETLSPRLNADAGLNYDFQGWNNIGGAAGGTGSSGFASMLNGAVIGNNGGANRMTFFKLQLLNPNEAKEKHAIIEQSIFDVGVSTPVSYNYHNLWHNVAVITAINLKLAAGNFNTASWYEVFGYNPS
jgi:hypothetical protein